MLITPTTDHPATDDPAIDSRSIAPPSGGRAARDRSARTAGLAALGFVAVVAAQNVLRGSSAPANDSSPEEVLSYFADHRTTTFLLAATFVVSGLALATFLGGVARSLLSGTRRAAAATGLVGGAVVLGLFSVVLGSEVALSVVANGDQPDLGAVQALWALHGAVFAVNFLAVAIALVGLARAGVATGITPAIFDRLAPIGAALLALGTAAGPAIAAGEAMALFGLALLGFLIWLAFLVTTGRRLVGTRVGS